MASGPGQAVLGWVAGYWEPGRPRWMCGCVTRLAVAAAGRRS